MVGRKYAHGLYPGIHAHELVVDFKNAAELSVQLLPGDVCQIEVDLIRAADPLVQIPADFVDGPGCDVSGNEVAVGRVPIFKKVPSLRLGNRSRHPLVAHVLGNPDTPALSASRFRHQSQLVRSGYCRRMDLHELSIGIDTSLLIHSRRCRSRTGCGICSSAENHARTSGSQHYGVRLHGVNRHVHLVHGHDAAAAAAVVEDYREKFPQLELAHLTVHLESPHLLIQGIEDLLSRRGPGERRPVMLRPAKAPEIQQTLRGPVKHHAHSVQQVDDAGSGVAHHLDRWLVGQKISAVDAVVEMLRRRVALAFHVHSTVDASLGAHRVGSLDRHE